MSESLKDKIRNRMKLLAIEPKRSLGQNFLVSKGVVKKIIEAAEIENFPEVYEIGPGLGALTDSIRAQTDQLTLIELDQKFAEFWRSKGQVVVEIDALRYPWEQLSKNKERLLISNLPYQISSRLVVDFSIEEPVFTRMVLMFQKEVAQRMQARVGTSDYGLLSVVAQSYWSIKKVTEAGAIDFFPKPNVASRVLRFDHQPIFESSVNNEDYLRFLKLSFANRRKMLLPKLTTFQAKEEVKRIFEKNQLDSKVRAENLSAMQFRDLYTSLKTE